MNSVKQIIIWRTLIQFATAQAWIECHLVHSYFHISTILSMMSLLLPNCLNFSYLYFRCYQKPHLLHSRWTGRRQKSRLWAAGRMSHQQSQSGAGGSGGICLSWLLSIQQLEAPHDISHRSAITYSYRESTTRPSTQSLHMVVQLPGTACATNCVNCC